MIYFKSILSLFLLYNLFLFSYADRRISNERKCLDEKCSVPISLAKTLLRYNSDDDRLLSFPRNAKATVFSKEAGDKPEFWEAEINGKRGYVPKEFLRESKLLVKKEDVNIIVSTGRDDGKFNATEEVSDNPGVVSSDFVGTPALPAASSKGFFGIMGGVSADSVPPNSPDIKPQTTEAFQVVDGTTIYEDSPPEILNSIMPSSEKVPSVKSSHLKDSKFDTKPKDDITLSFKESIDSIQKPALPFSKDAQSKETSDSNTAALHDSSEQKEVTLESIPDVKEIYIEKLDVKKDSSLESNIEQNIINDKKDHAENELGNEDDTENKIEEEINLKDQVHSQEKEVDKENKIETPSVESPGIFGNLMGQVANLISSGTGEILENNSNEENEDEDVVGSENEKESSGEIMREENDILTNEQPKLPIEVEEPIFVESESNSTKPEQLDNISKAPKLQDLANSDRIDEPVKATVLAENISNSPDVEVSTETSSREKEKEKDQKLQNINTPGKETESLLSSSSIPESEVSNDPNIKKDKSIEVKKDNQLHSETIQIQQVPREESKQSDNINPIVDPIVSSKDPETKVSSEVTSPSVKDKEKSPEITSESIVSVTSSESVVISPFHQPSLVGENKLHTEERSKVVPDVKPVYEEPESEEPNIVIDSKVPPHPFVDSSRVIEASNEISESKETIPEVATADVPPAADTNFATHKPPHVPHFFKERVPLHQQNDKPIYSAVVQQDEQTVPVAEEKETIKTETSAPSEVFQTSVINEEEKLEENKETFKEELFSTEAPLPDSSSEHSSVHEPLDEFITEEKINEEVTTESDSSEGFFSWLNPVFELFSSSETTNEDSLTQQPEEPSVVSESSDNLLTSNVQQEESCQAGGYGEEDCGAVKPVSDTVEEAATDSSWHQLMFLTDTIPATLELVEGVPVEITVWLIVTAVVVLIFSLGHYYIEAHRRDGPLVAVINKLEREVLILKKESSILEDRLHTAQEQVEAWNVNSSENDALVVELKQKLEETESAKAELEEQVAVLEKEVETTADSAMEMHSLLSESLSSQDGTQVLLSTVEKMREKLERQENEISGLSQSLANKNAEVDELKEKLAEAGEVSVELENKIISLSREKEEDILQLNDKHRTLLAQLEENEDSSKMVETKALDETTVSVEMSKLRLSIEELQKLLSEKDAELEEVKEVVKELRSTDSNEKMDALFDVVAVKAQLKAASRERDDFREKFLEEEGARKLLEGHMKKITQEVAELKNSFETAEKEKIDALTRLQVLSDYFKEKEGQLQKELGMKESLWLQKQSEDHTIYEQMRSLREENEKFKLQNESLKKEIVEQESSFKIQLANVEQKSHENWVASRQAERRLKEVQQEASQLRNRLTMEKSGNNFSSLDDSKQMNESNGDPSSPPASLIFPPTTSPPFMMFPPGDFVPPPPLVRSPYPPDSRPPPLGRISSPPLDHRFSPPLPYPPYEPFPPYGHHSPSPPPPLPPYTHHRNVHKPQPREMPRDVKDHSTSNYSPEVEKPSRRNKR